MLGGTWEIKKYLSLPFTRSEFTFTLNGYRESNTNEKISDMKKKNWIQRKHEDGVSYKIILDFCGRLKGSPLLFVTQEIPKGALLKMYLKGAY